MTCGTAHGGTAIRELDAEDAGEIAERGVRPALDVAGAAQKEAVDAGEGATTGLPILVDRGQGGNGLRDLRADLMGGFGGDGNDGDLRGRAEGGAGGGAGWGQGTEPMQLCAASSVAKRANAKPRGCPLSGSRITMISAGRRC